MKVCVQGMWHLGSVTAACLASIGHEVVGFDFDSKTIDGLTRGKAPLYEPGLDELIGKGIVDNSLQFSTQVKDATLGSEILWITYDTPVDNEDRANLEFVLSQIEVLIPHLSVGTTVLVSSQLPVGTIQKLENFASQNYPALDLGFAYSPENLRLGKAIDVFLKPDRIVVGVRNERRKLSLQALLSPISDRIEWMSVESAEMTKHAINAFLATSVAFANEIAAICELAGADAKEVEKGLKTEQRIGPRAYLSPGGAFSGGTLARDINFLNSIASSKGLRTPLISSVKPSNDEHKLWSRRRLMNKFPDLKGKCITVWGLTYKPGTNTLRRSLAVDLCNWLIQQGAILRVHDPMISGLPARWAHCVSRLSTPLEAVRNAEALVVGTEWPIYKNVPFEKIMDITPRLFVVDANRFLGEMAMVDGIEYVAVGSLKSDMK